MRPAYTPPGGMQPGRSVDGRPVYEAPPECGYQGTGWAWAIVAGGQVLRLAYLELLEPPDHIQALESWLAVDFERAGAQAAVALDAPDDADVVLGLCSGHELIAYDGKAAITRYVADYLQDLR